MSTLTYGDYSLLYVQTQEFRTEPESDPSGADMLWTKYTLRVSGVLTLDPNTLPNNSAATLASIKYHLELPRRRLTYTVNGADLLSVTAVPDARFGPEPTGAAVRQISSGVFFVEWGCVARIAGCGNEISAGGGPAEVVSLRWHQRETFDENWHSVLHTSGLLIVRTDLRKVSADSFRALCTPPVPFNFVRYPSSYTLDETGTKLAFEFTDTERDVMPPSLATRASGQFVLSEPMPGGMRIAICTVRLQGPPNSSRNDLMGQATSICIKKIEAAGPQRVSQTGQAIFGVVKTEMLYENVVEVQIQAKLSAFLTTQQRTTNLTTFGETPGSNPYRDAPGIAPPLRRQLAGLIANAFRDPCAQAAALETGDEGGTSELTSRSLPTRQARITQAVDVELRTKAYDEDDIGPYDWYQVEKVYEGDEGRALMPGTGVGPNPRAGKLVKVHGGSVWLTVNWTARRQGKPPILPSYPSKDPNLAEMGYRIIDENADFHGDPTKPIYTVSGQYRYAVIDPAQVSILSAVPPYLSKTAAKTSVLSASRFADDVLWGGGTGAVGGGGSLPGGSPGADVETDDATQSSGGDQVNQNPTAGGAAAGGDLEQQLFVGPIDYDVFGFPKKTSGQITAGLPPVGAPYFGPLAPGRQTGPQPGAPAGSAAADPYYNQPIVYP